MPLRFCTLSRASGFGSGLLILMCAAGSVSGAPAPVAEAARLTLVELKERDGQILSYRHLAGSTEVLMRGTRRAPEARIKLKVGSRPGFVELDINRGGITGLKPANTLGKDFLTYVLWAVSVDGKASNLGEITFQDEHAIAVNLTTPYQTFWLMVTAEPNYAVVDPSREVVLYSVKQEHGNDKRALPIDRPLFYFTHYSSYQAGEAGRRSDVPNQLLQARKAVELASKSGLFGAELPQGGLKEEEYTREALEHARTFLARAERAFRSNPRGEEVIQFARTAAQSAENARALATGAVGGLLVRHMEHEMAELQNELAALKAHGAESNGPTAPGPTAVTPASRGSVFEQVAALARRPALWFAVTGWGLTIVLLFRPRRI